MTARKTPTLDALAEREQQAIAASMKVHEVENQAAHAKAEAARITEELTEAYATGNDDQATKLTRAKKTADNRAAEPWTERIAGAKRAANRVQAEVDAWRIANVGKLLAELTPDAHAAAAAITAKVTELEDARKHWHAISSQVAGVVRDAPGYHGRPLAGIDAIDQAIRDLRRGITDVPPPLPRTLQSFHIPPEHDPDPDIRNAARAAALATRGEG